MSPRNRRIRFHQGVHGRAEVQAVARLLREGRTGGGGKVSRRVETSIRRWTGGARVLLVPSGTAALELALMLLDLQPGDEVVLPSFAFVSDANAIIRAGGRPVFAEVEEDTLNLSPEDVTRRLSRRTRAVLAVHYGGSPCRMGDLLAIGRKRGLTIVEDAAHAYGGRWQGRPLGGIGDLGVFSFHETKNLSCGEGGALSIRDRRHVARAELIQEKGTDRARFLRGEVQRYVWRSVGSSFLLSEILAAILEEQLRRAPRDLAARRRRWKMYHKGLAPLAETGRLALPPLEGKDSACHIFFFRVGSGRQRDRVIRRLRRDGIEATFHFVPLHSSPYGRSALGCRPGDLPVTERIARTLVRLPLHASLRVADVGRVIRAVGAALG